MVLHGITDENPQPAPTHTLRPRRCKQPKTNDGKPRASALIDDEDQEDEEDEEEEKRRRRRNKKRIGRMTATKTRQMRTATKTQPQRQWKKKLDKISRFYCMVPMKLTGGTNETHWGVPMKLTGGTNETHWGHQ